MHPVISLTLWFVSNVSLTLLNKASFDQLGFNFPFLLSGLHMAVSSIFAFVVIYIFKLAPTPHAIDRNYLWKGIIPFSFLFTLNVALSNVSLSFVTVSLHQVVKSAIPASSMLFSYIFLGERYDIITMLSLVPIILGVALAPLGETQFNLNGFLLSVAGNFSSSMKVVTSAMFLGSQSKSIHPITLLYLMAPWSFFEQILLGYIFGEVDDLMKWQERGNLVSVGLIFLTGFLAFFINWANFSVVRDTSALTLAVAGNTKNLVTIFLSIIISRTSVTTMKMMGIVLSCSGAALYSYVRYLKSENDKEKKKDKSLIEADSTKETDAEEKPKITRSSCSPLELTSQLFIFCLVGVVAMTLSSK